LTGRLALAIAHVGRLYFDFVPNTAAISVSTRPAGAANPLAFQDDFDPLAPQREAALFYGLFLRGHSADALRRDIDVPKKLLDKLMRRHRNELAVQARLQRTYTFRKQVLAIFDELVTREQATGPMRVH
jgi:hypothetical protein